MRSPLRLVTMLLGVFFSLQGVSWLVRPQAAAEGLGMPLLDGVGRSTQIGDFSTFFLTAGIVILLGSRPGRGRAQLLYLPGTMIGSAAVLRTFAWAFHGAAFATPFIVIELVTSAVLLRAAGRFREEEERMATPPAR